MTFFVAGAPDPGLRILLPSKRKSRRIQVRPNAATVRSVSLRRRQLLNRNLSIGQRIYRNSTTP